MTTKVRREISDALRLWPYPPARRIAQLIEAQRRKCSTLTHSRLGRLHPGRLMIALHQRDRLIEMLAAQVAAAERIAP